MAEAKLVKGPMGRPPRGVKPQVENPGKIFVRIMKYVLKELYASLHHCCGFNFCQRAGKRTGNHVHEDPDRRAISCPC